MQISILAAGFTPGEADGLRRAMAAWKRKGGLEKYYDRIVDGMTARGYEKAFAEAIFEQIKGFSEYGFPESHAASFALLVYASSWIKCAEPAVFLAAMLNSQPLGFYSPSQLVQDAKRHGVEVRAVDVMASEVDATLEDMPHEPAVRLGLRLVSGLRRESAVRIVSARTEGPFENAEDLSRRANLEQHEMRLLAAADALASLSGHRRQQVWDAAALHAPPELLREAPVDEERLNRQLLLQARDQKRSDRFFADARLPRAERAELSDYKGSGYARGHMAPAGDMFSPTAMDQSFSLANMVPQNPQQNSGSWAKIEADTRSYVMRAKGDVYVITGPVFESNGPTVGANQVRVPTHLFKLVYDATTQRAWAHWQPNSADARPGRPISYGELERLTGMEWVPGVAIADDSNR